MGQTCNGEIIQTSAPFYHMPIPLQAIDIIIPERVWVCWLVSRSLAIVSENYSQDASLPIWRAQMGETRWTRILHNNLWTEHLAQKLKKFNPCPTITLAVSSIELTCCTFSERDIGIRYGSGNGHDAMIPLRQIISFSLFALNCHMSSDMTELTIAI